MPLDTVFHLKLQRIYFGTLHKHTAIDPNNPNPSNEEFSKHIGRPISWIFVSCIFFSLEMATLPLMCAPIANANGQHKNKVN